MHKMNKMRPFGRRSGLFLPPVNIGAMRLPEDDDKAVELIRYAIDRGMRYIDTSRGYGESEIKVGKALKGGYREKVILSTKWSPWIVKIDEKDDTSADSIRRRIEESMERLDVDYLDFYQVWNIDSREHYDLAVAEGGMVEGILKAVDDKLVRHTGFTTHDTVDNLDSYIREADWCETILFTYNILNDLYAPAIEAAHKQGIGTVIMNPVGGGMLNCSSSVFDGLVQDLGARSLPDIGIRYILSNPNVDAIISGITSFSDVDDSILSSSALPFTYGEIDLVRSRVEPVIEKRKSFCTACGYCMPCPQGINIPRVMEIIARQRFWGFKENARRIYREMNSPGGDSCTRCGACESKCTQHLSIMEEMAYAEKEFSETS